jgi:VWFA-related protein
MKIWLLLPLLSTIALSQDDVVFRSGVSLVRVDAEAIDANGRVVAGLTKDDFRVLDEGAPQPISNFSFEEEPLDLILLFDTAGSMRGKLLNVVRATELGFHELHKSDRIAVRAFNAGSVELLPFTSDLEAVNEAILIQVLKMKFGGVSRIEAAADEAALRYRTERDTHRKRAVLIVTDKPGNRGTNGANDEGAVRDLWNANAVLSELILDRGPQTKLLERGTNEIVDQTGGATIEAGAPGEAFLDSVHYLRSGYTMYYALPGPASQSGGSVRKIQVELTADAAKRLPGVRIRARSGYIVSK